MIRRSHPPLGLPGRDDFLWATGIEDTFIAEPHHATGRTLDEYALTDHYGRWDEDLALASGLGVKAIRYGIPWYRVNPAQGRFVWEWTDRVLDRLVNQYGLEPVIDLVHYGTPLWLERSFLAADYPARVAEYAAAFAERYRGLCYWYTPLNEPRVNAWYAGRLGWWPPHRKGSRGFLEVLLQLCRGICLTQRAIAEVEPAALFVHVDATDLYVPADPDDAVLAAEARRRQEIVFLAVELVMGRGGSLGSVGRMGSTGSDLPYSPYLPYITHADLEWFAAHAVQPHVIGYNMYPMYSRKVVHRVGGRVRVRIHRCWAETLAELTRLYAARFPGVPLMITETASAGSIARRQQWITDSVSVVHEARASGLPVIGYTFWPLFSLVTWAYQQGTKPLAYYLFDMGLYDLTPALERQWTPVVDTFRQEVAAGVKSAPRAG